MDRNIIMHTFVSKIKKGILVEIGTYTAYFSCDMLSHSDGSILYCVDPYISYDEYKDGMNELVDDKVYEEAYKKLTSKYGNRARFIRKKSNEAFDLIPKNIDFLYIDGNHSYKYVLEDLELYYPKVAPGGIIMGDDAHDTEEYENVRDLDGDVYFEWLPGKGAHYGVKKAFDDFTKKYDLMSILISDQYIIKKPIII
jgi:predicted O-methyltransferase YrrM